MKNMNTTLETMSKEKTELEETTTPAITYSECYAQVFLGDCLEQLKNIKSETIDCVATDPPYKVTSGGNVPTGFIN
ncbi:MAG: hypothetical protein PHC31_11710, partial [Clostridia bacterium]|nr:hypothetical protein [Clostridia bacterium]